MQYSFVTLMKRGSIEHTVPSNFLPLCAPYLRLIYTEINWLLLQGVVFRGANILLFVQLSSKIVGSSWTVKITRLEINSVLWNLTEWPSHSITFQKDCRCYYSNPVNNGPYDSFKVLLTVPKHASSILIDNIFYRSFRDLQKNIICTMYISAKVLRENQCLYTCLCNGRLYRFHFVWHCVQFFMIVT